MLNNKIFNLLNCLIQLFSITVILPDFRISVKPMIEDVFILIHLWLFAYSSLLGLCEANLNVLLVHCLLFPFGSVRGNITSFGKCLQHIYSVWFIILLVISNQVDYFVCSSLIGLCQTNLIPIKHVFTTHNNKVLPNTVK